MDPPGFFRRWGCAPGPAGSSMRAIWAMTGESRSPSEAMVRECFPTENPIGRPLVCGEDCWEIIVIVGDVHLRGLARPAWPIVYRAIPTDPWRNATLFGRTPG